MGSDSGDQLAFLAGSTTVRARAMAREEARPRYPRSGLNVTIRVLPCRLIVGRIPVANVTVLMWPETALRADAFPANRSKPRAAFSIGSSALAPKSPLVPGT